MLLQGKHLQGKEFLDLLVHGSRNYKYCFISVFDFSLEVVQHQKYYVVESIKTNKILELKYIDQVRNFDFSLVSNYEFDEMEFNTWIKLMDDKGLKPPSLRFIENKVKSLQEMQTKGYSDRQMNEIIHKNIQARIKKGGLKEEIKYYEEKLGKLKYKQF